MTSVSMVCPRLAGRKLGLAWLLEPVPSLLERRIAHLCDLGHARRQEVEPRCDQAVYSCSSNLRSCKRRDTIPPMFSKSARTEHPGDTAAGYRRRRAPRRACRRKLTAGRLPRTKPKHTLELSRTGRHRLPHHRRRVMLLKSPPIPPPSPPPSPPPAPTSALSPSMNPPADVIDGPCESSPSAVTNEPHHRLLDGSRESSQ